MTHVSDHSSIPVLDPQVALPQFIFFQAVKVKLTGEVATIVGMKYNSSSEQPENQNQEWLYLLKGLIKLGAVWWKFDQLRTLDHR